MVDGIDDVVDGWWIDVEGKVECSEESGNKYFIEESGDQQARRVKRANDQVTLTFGPAGKRTLVLGVLHCRFLVSEL